MVLFLKEGWATASFVLLIGALVAVLLICLWLRHCYFPGGYKRSEVIDIGEYALFNAKRMAAQMKDAETKIAIHDHQAKDLDELYYEVDDSADHAGRGRTRGARVSRPNSFRPVADERVADWHSVHESDVEGTYYDTSDAPTRRSAEHGLKSALKGSRTREDKSVTNTTPTPLSRRPSDYSTF